MPGIKLQINKPDVKQIGVWFVLMMVVCQALPASQPALAQGTEPPIPPAPTGGNVVLDTLDWLTPDQEAEINGINKNLDDAGIAQIAVVTLDDCGPDKKTFRYHLFNTWGIGHSNDNDGLLILLCWYGGDKSRRSVEQEVGYGLESTLPSALTDSIAKDYFVTAFQENHPGQGLVDMVKRYDGLLRQKNQKPASTTPSKQAIIKFAQLPEAVVIFLAIITLAVLITSAILFGKVVYLEKTRGTKREEAREPIIKRRLLLIITRLLICDGTLLLGFGLHFTVGIIFLVITGLFSIALSSWSYHGRISNKDQSWFSNGGSGGTGGLSGGGGFGGGSSGGGGSSTGF